MSEQQPARSADDIVAGLRAMGAALDQTEPNSDTVTAVLARIDLEPTPRAERLAQLTEVLVGGARRRWRTVLAVLTALLVVLLAASPVGARVREWLGFGAVVVQEQVSAPAPQSASGPAGPLGDLIVIPLEQAAAAVTFPLVRPALLPAPASVAVSADRRLVTMSWSGSDLPGATPEVRLDQLSGTLPPYFFKKYYPDVDFTRVGDGEALWLRQPHPIVVVGADGSERSETARLSGPALIWQSGSVTLRLEGIDDLASAAEIAESTNR